jgi:3'-5' exoribonuclease
MARLPPARSIDGAAVGTGFFLCARKERRTGKAGPFLVLGLQDVTGDVDAKVFQDVDAASQQFEAGEFVAVQGRGNVYNGRTELILERIRRVIPSDAALGFREEDCVPCSPRPIDEMWAELEQRIASVESTPLRALLHDLVTRHADRLRIWPAARQVHHAYRSGLLEHILKIIDVGVYLADAYGAKRDLVIAGALLHDLGKLQELSYDVSIDYSLEGNLVGHIVIGAMMLREAAAAHPDLLPDVVVELEHLILSHHGARELGSPVTPMTAEAFILAAADDLDAKLQQVHRHVTTDSGPGRFTSYHRYLERVLLKPGTG